MRRFEVYADSDNWLFSDAVTRDFGENRSVTLVAGRRVFSAVSRANEFTRQLPVVGFIEAQCCGACQDACNNEPDDLGIVFCSGCVAFAIESVVGS